MSMDFPRIAIIGDTGGGKTLTATVLAHMYKAAGMNVYANYSLFDIDYTHIAFKDILDFPEYLHDGIIILDEAHIGLDAYDFFKKDVRTITKFITQIRKRRLIFVYTTQSFDTVAVRLRNLTNYLWYCQETDTAGVIYIQIHDRDPDDSFIRDKILDGRSYFDKYDTNEIIENE